MIGMSQIKKKTIQGVAIGLAIGVVGVGLSLWWGIATVKSYENGNEQAGSPGIIPACGNVRGVLWRGSRGPAGRDQREIQEKHKRRGHPRFP